MASTSHRASIYPFQSTTRDAIDGRKSQAAPRKEIWSSLLKSVSSGKRLPEKQLLLLGGAPETQRDFLDSLSTGTSGARRQQSKRPPVANQYALGYTYQDVLDADHEDILARLSVYTLTDPSPTFASLLKPLLTPKTLPNTLIVILLDWGQPWNWVRQLRDWVRLLRSIMVSLDDESKDVMEENIIEWRDRKRNNAALDGTTNSSSDAALPLGSGEWDEPLGIPLSVVCQNADKMQQLETERGWKDEQFDFVGQYIRTVLLKHGASLIYTMPSAPGSLQILIHSSLGIQSTLQKKELKHEVSNRDKTLVPPNWDSWGKIRLMADNFDVEAISKTWSSDIRLYEQEETARPEEDQEAERHSEEPNGIESYEKRIRDPKKDSFLPGLVRKNENGIEVESKEVQSFLAEQAAILDGLRKEDDQEKVVKDAKKAPASYISSTEDRRDVEEHIGPVQFNMGGIQVDADDMLKRLKDREATRSTDNEPKTPSSTSKGNQEAENQRLKDFFANLAKKPGGSNPSTPRRTEG